MTVLVDGSEIILFGTVGDLWLGDCFTAAEVSLALAQVGRDKDVTIRLNSGGGVATEGAAIHSVISGHGGRKTIVVEGIAASAAATLALAGDEVVMSLGAVMMIHDPENITWGTADDHRRTIAGLDAVATAAAGIYARKTGKTVEATRAEMKAELWMTPEEAVAKGYADRAETAANDNPARQHVETPPFDYRRYANAPKHLATMALDKNWTLPTSGPRPTASAPIRQTQETYPMPNERERAEAAEAELATLKAAQAKQSSSVDAQELATLRKEKSDRERRDAIMALDESKGREAQATALADAGIDVEKARTVLAAAPVPPEPPKDPKEPARQSDAQSYESARLAGAGLQRGGERAESKSEKILANYRSVTGQKAAS